MNPQLTATVIFLLIFSVLVVITHLLYSIAKVDSAQSRKFIHVTGGILALTLPSYLHSHWYVLAVCLAAFLLLTFTFYRRLLPSIHKTSRISFGSFLFPLPIYICFLVAEKMQNNMLLFYLPISLLTIADTVAEIAGKKWGHFASSLHNNQKTLIGSLSFAVVALLISIIYIVFVFHIETSRSMILIVTITVVTTFAELYSVKGYDNLSVPFSALLLLRLFL